MFSNSFGADTSTPGTLGLTVSTKQDSNSEVELLSGNPMELHPDISLKDGEGEKNVNSLFEFDRFYSNSLSSLIGDFISKAKLDNLEKANEYHKSKERGHLMFRKDEVPKFLANRHNRDAQQQELEERLGFGYEELYYLYRENTEINVRCNRLEDENASLRAQLKSVDPVIVVEDVHSVSVSVQNQLKELYAKLREAE